MMVGGRKYFKLWLIIVIMIFIIIASFSYLIQPTLITEPVYQRITFDKSEGNGTINYNSEGKIHISSVELPESIYPNQNFTMKITFVSENSTEQQVWIYSFIPEANVGFSVELLSSDRNIIILPNTTTVVEVQCKSFVEVEYVEGVGPTNKDLIDYDINNIYLFVRETGWEDSTDIAFLSLEMPIELKSYGNIVLTEYILIGAVIIVGVTISLKWFIDEDWYTKKKE